MNFLTGNNLTKFSTKELEKVNEIGAFFLSDNLLTSFSAESLKNVQTIGYGFLSHNNLTEFSTKGLEKVTSIGAKFLSDNTNLTHVDLRGLKNIEELGEGMFDYCGNIKEIIASKEKEEFFKKNIPDHLVKKIVVK